MNLTFRAPMTPNEFGGENTGLVGIISTAAAAFVGAFLFLRRWLSSDANERRKDQADVDAIDRLMKLLDSERKRADDAEARADQFAKERNDAVKMIGELKGEIAALRQKVESLEIAVGGDSHHKTE
jgi:hypothetical protein